MQIQFYEQLVLQRLTAFHLQRISTPDEVLQTVNRYAKQELRTRYKNLKNEAEHDMIDTYLLFV